MELKDIIRQSDNIVFFGGAGVSTESGIPDFRSESGIYAAISEFGYEPERILSRSFFMDKTELFFEFYRDKIIHTEAVPNDAHKALAKLEAIGKMKAVITQNIDGLHQMAGSETVLELHGSVHRNFCMTCGCAHDLADITDAVGIPKCRVCGGIVKPDVVLYEEQLDEDTINKSVRAITEAEVLIVGGTSLSVYPAAGFINYFSGKSMVLINKGKTSYDYEVDLLIRDSIGKVLREATEGI